MVYLKCPKCSYVVSSEQDSLGKLCPYCSVVLIRQAEPRTDWKAAFRAKELDQAAAIAIFLIALLHFAGAIFLFYAHAYAILRLVTPPEFPSSLLLKIEAGILVGQGQLMIVSLTGIFKSKPWAHWTAVFSPTLLAPWVAISSPFLAFFAVPIAAYSLCRLLGAIGQPPGTDTAPVDNDSWTLG